MAAILGKKLGMTQVFGEDGTVTPVTVIEAGPCKVTAVREAERDGYAAVQLAFGEVKQGKLSKPEEGHLHPVYMCYPGTLMRRDMLVCIYHGGKWLRIGNAGNPWDTDVSVFEKFK